VLEPTEGRIVLEGRGHQPLAPHQRVRRGMVRTFQINQLFASMTPLETLAPGGVAAARAGRAGGSAGPRSRGAERAEQLLAQFTWPKSRTEDRAPAYGKRRLLRSRSRWPANRACCC
jgi:branched-chain amino acid transport system ATP-binding protein